MKNSSLYNEYISNICQKELLMNCNESNENNINVVLYKSENAYNNYTKLLTIDSNNYTEFTEDFLTESNNFNKYNKNTSLDNFNDTDINSYHSELSSRSENYLICEYSENYSNITMIVSTIIQTEEKNEIIQNIIDNLLHKFDMVEIDNGKNEIIKKQNK